ncbi:MAG: putative nicotinate-nucleotide pyrophosphorylase (carboxylating) [Deltaproteobacteria bacterium ADurb.Bin207]|nr:MAG: putative nicotinate-nucleotide pyrophosphorylase (carboxylating) [Deltaproteobacteria bacterium ADurb.Bin207]HPY17780.1 carboxylating nicotinate-nucleotide diphosphorylase [Polyangiaceae bacterium]HQB43109.1 carboxylating nicotinate-nucleotide diphosphorylase [Polyangiaceae bacterium]HQF24381.1 carboxylating nicotinate-nucleotide diphosphorylase [Polyangiaceae bacterium]
MRERPAGLLPFPLPVPIASCTLHRMLLPIHYQNLVEQALLEDLAGGDITTMATVAPDTRAYALAVARTSMVACGADVFSCAFRLVDATLHASLLVRDGEEVTAGTTLWRVEGCARSILMAERVALNFAQRMTGIATRTRAFVRAIPPGLPTRITDTRKTTPGLRILERYAVRKGGGHNHRDDLASAVLIKDNHIVAAGGIPAAVVRARNHAPHTTRIEVEVDTLAQLEEALAAGADIILLDNFSLENTKRAVELTQGKARLEVSGGVNLDQIAAIAQLGIDIISVGGLTHSSPAADIGLDMELLP